ncbi:MAG: hypothetical protein JWM22_28 [Frankiales bacterium]|nr:hypothetical protein [Frankiales bacterium]
MMPAAAPLRLINAPRGSRAGRWVPLALIALAAIPITAGTLRLVEVFGGPHNLPTNPRITASPAPVVIHIVTASLYAVLGALQFSVALRRRHPRWHRMSGRLVVPLGLTVALSALWMMAFYSGPQDTNALLPIRFAFGIGLAACITIGLVAIRRGDVRRHQAWMTRGYAIALGAGTQVFTLGLGKPVVGSGPLAISLLLIAAWCINLPIAEYVLRRTRRARGRRPAPAVQPA